MFYTTFFIIISFILLLYLIYKLNFIVGMFA